MGWCRGGKVDGWLAAGLTARQALAARLTAKQVPGLAATTQGR